MSYYYYCLYYFYYYTGNSLVTYLLSCTLCRQLFATVGASHMSSVLATQPPISGSFTSFPGSLRQTSRDHHVTWLAWRHARLVDTVLKLSLKLLHMPAVLADRTFLICFLINQLNFSCTRQSLSMPENYKFIVKISALGSFISSQCTRLTDRETGGWIKFSLPIPRCMQSRGKTKPRV